MNFWLLCNFVVFVLCVMFAGIFIPQILLVAFKKDLFDMPDERKIHKVIVPRLGGIAFTPVICFTVSLILGITMLVGDSRLMSLVEAQTLPLSMGFCSLFLMYIVGVGDDLVGVRYRAKFVAQILCAVFIIMGGFWINSFHGFLWIDSIPAWLGWPLTVLYIVFVCNALNLIDGIDGLASGLAMTGFIIYGVTFYLLGQYVYAMLSFASLGVLVPFFYYNVFGNPAKRKKIFMGDAGSLTVGLLLSFLSLHLFTAPTLNLEGFYCNSFVVAVSPLIVPCFDVVRVFIGRVRKGNNPFLPDRTHIHHKLLSLGMPSRRAMVTIVGVALFFSVANICLANMLNITLLIILDIAFWALANMALSRAVKSCDKNKVSVPA